MMVLVFAKLFAQLYVNCKVRQEHEPGRGAESLATFFLQNSN